MIGMSTLIRLREDDIRFQLLEFSRNRTADIWQMPHRFLIDEAQTATARARNPGKFESPGQLFPARCSVFFARSKPVPDCIGGIERGAVGRVNDPDVAEIAQQGARPDHFIVRVRHYDDDSIGLRNLMHAPKRYTR